MSDVVHVAPLSLPLSLTEIKTHLRVDHSDEDAKITALTWAAVNYVEAATSRALVAHTRRIYADSFADASVDVDVVEIARGPLRAVSSITYSDTNGNAQTLSTTDYTVDKFSQRARIMPSYGKWWPATRSTANSITIEYRAGHSIAATANASTDTITAASHGYSNGDVVQLYNSGGALPGGLSESIAYYVVGATSDTLQLSITSGGAAVDITGAGTGTHFLGVVPRPLLEACLLLIGHLYENREATNAQPLAQIPLGIDALCSPYRIF